jgi:GntR family transcriptional regulator/MocR family aminotransferase
LFRQVYEGLRSAIVTGTVRAGEKLPATRALAEDLGVSRTTVVLAYEQLLAEGFISGRGGSGTYVSGAFPSRPAALQQVTASTKLSRFGASVTLYPSPSLPEKRPSLRYDFSFGKSDLDLFPFAAWRRLLLRCIRKFSLHAYDYRMPSGSLALRESIATHLARARAVRCDASQVIIVNGSQQALDLACRVLLDRGDRAVIEDPQYLGMREVFRAAGVHLHPVPVDEDGLDTSKLPNAARLAVVTPSHQFPTGTILSMSRRLELLNWARRCNAMVLEDDYDGEFRYGGQPLESLQGLDREGRVIYTGTFSRTMFSSMRIGYIVVPKSLLKPFTAAKWLADKHTATLEQEALSEFINQGTYERYLRRVRRKNAQRRAALLRAIADYLPSEVRVSGDGAGTHILLWLPAPYMEQETVSRAAQLGVGVYGISPYFIESGRSRPGLLIGYARMTERQIREGIQLLATALAAAARARKK